MRHLMSQITSVPTPVHTAPHPSESQSTPQDVVVFYYQQMNFSSISPDLPDIMMTTGDDDIPDIEDISDSAHLDNIQDSVWFA